MNSKNKGFLGLIALGLIAVLFGGSVAALGTSVVASADAATKVVVDKPRSISVDSADRARIELNTRHAVVEDASESRRLLQVRLADDIRDAVKERLDKFRDAVKDLRRFIVDYRKNPDRSSFEGWTTNRIVNESGLSAEDKRELLAAYSESTDHAAEWTTHGFTMWSVDNEFVLTGRFSGVMTDMGSAGTAKGFSNMNEQPLFIIWGSGTFAGVQNGVSFWGTYNANYDATLTFEDGRTIQTKYMIY